MRYSAVVVFALLVMLAPDRSAEAALFPSDISPRQFLKHVQEKFLYLEKVRKELEFQRLNGSAEVSSDMGHRGASRVLLQANNCIDMEVELVRVAGACTHVYQSMDCHGSDMLDRACSNRCISQVRRTSSKPSPRLTDRLKRFLYVCV